MILRSELADVLTDNLAIIVADIETGLIVYATKEAEMLFDYKMKNSLIGICVDRLVPMDRREQHTQHRAEFASDPHVRAMGTGMILQGERRDGSVFPVQVTLAPAVMDGKPSVVAVVVDLTNVNQTLEQRTV